MNLTVGIATIFVVAIVTAITRGLPYIVFGKREIPETLKYLETVFPASIMIILVCYCIRDVKFTLHPYGLPEILSILLVGSIQFWRRNAILSIAVGTIFYIVLIRTNIFFS